MFGTPNETNGPDAKTLSDYVDFKPQYPKPLKIMFSAANTDVLSVLETMLQLNPSKRCTCKEALQMAYFSNAPGPTPVSDLPQPMSIVEQIKNKSDALAKLANSSKRKLSEETSGLKKKLNFRLAGTSENGLT